MHKILVTSQAIQNDNADNCLNVLLSICQRDNKDVGWTVGGLWAVLKDDEDICLLCVHIEWPMRIQWSDAMQNTAVHFINERALQRGPVMGLKMMLMMTRLYKPKTKQNRKRTTTSNIYRRGGDVEPQPKHFRTKFLWKLVSHLITSLFFFIYFFFLLVCKLE